MKLSDIAEYLNGQLNGPAGLDIVGPAKIEEACENEITFISNPKYEHFASTTHAGAIVIDREIADLKKPHIMVKNAYVGFLMLLKLFSSESRTDFSGISEQAVIDPSATLDDSVTVGPFVYIGADVHVGKNTVLYPGVVLLNKVRVGADCIFYPNVSVREDCIIGDRVILQNGCVIGSDGFGFAPQAGRYIKIPQIGNVIIENDVEVGANTTIDRATLGSTIIKEGTKLDNLVQVAHNVVIGKHSAVASQTGFAGSARTGDNVTIGGQAGINGHINIGNGVTIAGQSGVTKDVADGAVLFGTPALPLTQRKRIDVSMKHLPEMNKRIRQLEKQIEQLKSNLNNLRGENGSQTADNKG